MKKLLNERECKIDSLLDEINKLKDYIEEIKIKYSCQNKASEENYLNEVWQLKEQITEYEKEIKSLIEKNNIAKSTINNQFN